MTEAPPAWLAAVCAALLAQGQRIDALSRLLTVGALLLAPFAPQNALAGLGLVVAAGILQLYLAIRVGFDAALFGRLADMTDLAGMDAALLQLALIPAAKAGRSLAPRLAGARRLLRGQRLALALQLAALLVVIVLHR